MKKCGKECGKLFQEEDSFSEEIEKDNEHEFSKNYRLVVRDNKDFSKDYVSQPIIAPKRKMAVLTCMDARILPDRIMGFDFGDSHVIRNAGGRATEDSIRSLIISHKLLGTNEWFVIHHVDCGMQKFDNKTISVLLEHSLETSTLIKDCNNKDNPSCVCIWKDTGKCKGNDLGYDINWYTFQSLKKSVTEDVRIIRSNKLVPKDISIYGFIFDVYTGRLIPVRKANEEGKAEKIHCREKDRNKKSIIYPENECT